MPKKNTTVLREFDFRGGINSDASAVAFPEDANLDEQNMEMLVNGSRRRRRGLSLETSGTYASKTLDTNDRQSAYLWRTPGGDPTAQMVVVKVKNELWFYEVGSNISSNKKSYTFDLHTIKTSTTARVDNNPVQFDAAPGGGLAVVGKYIEPLIVNYDASADEFEEFPVTLKARDFEGVEDGLSIDEHPTTLSTEHDYNLKNQGWTDAKITEYNTAESEYPSNSQVWHTGKIINPSTNEEEFSPTTLKEQDFGNATAPKGRYIYNVFNTSVVQGEGQTTIDISSSSYSSGTTTITTGVAHSLSVDDVVEIFFRKTYTDPESGGTIVVDGSTSHTVTAVNSATEFEFEGGGSGYDWTHFVSKFERPDGRKYVVRPTTVAAFAGRIFYAGIEVGEYEDSLFFSQIIQRENEYGKCYQANDPTSEHYNQLLDTDGGRLIISGAAGIKKIIPYSRSLLVFADNGVWEVGPGERGFFSPISYYVRKLHDVGTVSGASVVAADNAIFYFGTDGIYACQYDPESRQIEVGSVSIGIYNDNYFSIAESVRQNVQGIFESSSQQVVWLHSATDGTNTHRYTEALIFNKRFGAFTRYKFYDTSAMYCTSLVALADEADFTSNMKFLVYDATNTRLSWFGMSAKFDDFAEASDNGGEEEAYIITGYDIANDPQMVKSMSHVYCYFKKTETGFSEDGSGDLVLDNPSGCTMQTRWDWADHANSGKFGPGQQVYRFRRNYLPTGPGDTFEDGHPVVFTRNKVRGRGHAISIKFSADTGKDMWLLGWAALVDVVITR